MVGKAQGGGGASGVFPFKKKGGGEFLLAMLKGAQLLLG